MENGGGCRTPAIKIRIPAAEEMGHHCKECGKRFSSGKALGGHMSSAHVQAVAASSKKACKRNSPTAATSCNLCGKDFQSRKSLFGHMRCHPERKWRGMEPPPHAAQLGFLNGWPTSKRGRPPLSSSDSDNTKDAFVAGLELIRMLKDDGETNRDDDDRYVTAIQVLVSGRREREARVSAERGAASASTSDASNTAFVFDVDLNVPAEEEEEEEEGDSSNS